MFMDQDDLTDWFKTAAISDEKEFDGVSISKEAEDTIVASFRTGNQFSVFSFISTYGSMTVIDVDINVLQMRQLAPKYFLELGVGII